MPINDVHLAGTDITTSQLGGRVVVKALPSLRRHAGKVSGDFYLPRNYSLSAARASLVQSLRELGTDYIDLFLLHEPLIESVQAPELCQWLGDMKDRGLIRAWGVAGCPKQLAPICKELPQLAPLIQLPNDIINRQIEDFNNYKQAGIITFSPYAYALGAIQQYLASDQAIARRWSDKIGFDIQAFNAISSLLLGYCVSRNPTGVVLFFSARTQAIDAAANERPPQQSIDAFAQLVHIEIR